MRQRAACACFLWLAACGVLWSEEPTYEGVFADGARLSDARLFDWRERNQQPKLNDRPLFDANNPVRWLGLNKSAAAQTPEAFVEMIGGDRLPGRAVGFAAEAVEGDGESAAHLVVEPAVRVDGPDGPAREQLLVRTRWLRRIVFSARPTQSYEPGTLFYRDGRKLAFRSLRFTPGGVTLLVEGGRVEASFGDIAELHLPRSDFWSAWLEQLAILTPAGDSRLMRLETVDGLRVTVSLERFFAMNQGGEPERWIHVLQPAWLLEPLWVQHIRIRQRLFIQPHELPLSLIEPDRIEMRSPLGGGWRPQADLNVQGGPLVAANLLHGWGYGVQSYTALEFELPAAARSFRTKIALDQVVGDGGCARAAVYVNQVQGEPLFRSKLLIGSNEVIDSGALALPADGKPGRLILVADPADSDRPPGADPLNIRDCVDWLEPLLELDPVLLKAELRKAVVRAAPGFEGWSVAEPESLVFSNRWEDLSRNERRFRLEARPQPPFALLSRSVRIAAEQPWLLVFANRHRDQALASGSRIQVRLDGAARADFETPARNEPVAPPPFAIPVEKYSGRSVQLDVFLLPENDRSYVNWGSVGFSERFPGLLTVFEDEAPAGEMGAASVIGEDAFSGRTRLQVPADQAARLTLGGAGAAIREYPQVGEYRYIRFAWKKSGGRNISVTLPYEGRRGKAARAAAIDLQAVYHAGEARPKEPDVKNIRVADSMPEKWTLIQRDLLQDFGPGVLSELVLSSGEDSPAQFDHIYLARRPQDFDRSAPRNDSTPAAATADANVLAVAKDSVAFGQTLGDFAPAFSTAAVGEGGMQLLREHQGKQNVLRTAPIDQGRPCVLRCPLDLPAGKPAQLKLIVGRHAEGDWLLVVKAGEQKLLEKMIDRESAKEGWAEISVDLSRLAGSKAVLELHNQANNWSHEEAYWARIAIVAE